MTIATSFGAWDWAVLGVYFALLVASGVWLARRVKSSSDYFLAGRSMPAWAVTLSVLATSLSAATFVGGPQYAYSGDLTYLSGTIGTILASLVVAVVFIPAFYRHGVSTVYELLGVRYGEGARRAASGMFMVGRVFASGARIYIAAHALSFIAFGDLEPLHLLVSVALLTIAGILYTISGGIETVIWTDVVQSAVFFTAIIAALLILYLKIPATLPEIIAAAGEGSGSKLSVLSLSLDPGRAFTLWTAVTGVMLLNLAALGTDQDLVQRMLTCRSPLRASASVIGSQVIAIPVVLIFLLLGLLLWGFYTRADLMGGAFPLAEGVSPPAGEEVFLAFITAWMPPGLSGLMIAGLFAIGLSSLDSALNAMSSAFVSDFYKRLSPGREERHYLGVARAGVVGFGLALGLFAAFCVWWQHRAPATTLIDFALGVMVYAYTGLLAVFLAALLTKRGSQVSVFAALATGFLLTLATEGVVFEAWTSCIPALAATPGVDDGFRLGELSLAFPWRMVVATAGAFAVCCLGSRGRG